LSTDAIKDARNIDNIESILKNKLASRNEVLKADRLKYMNEWNDLRRTNEEYMRKINNNNNSN